MSAIGPGPYGIFSAFWEAVITANGGGVEGDGEGGGGEGGGGEGGGGDGEGGGGEGGGGDGKGGGGEGGNVCKQQSDRWDRVCRCYTFWCPYWSRYLSDTPVPTGRKQGTIARL